MKRLNTFTFSEMMNQRDSQRPDFRNSSILGNAFLNTFVTLME